ncbi:hypothetical protein HC031_31920 [Planosporangium thailandense]|uniref:Polysaccharide chain length determinant N-terminal domain-containing protein n=1 Tax=Planosporangium thailandense TaxID=765197 RepID=A0ABX0YA58_9ACTN|nr:hypothetical protein [Planosporangium thailandense]NJC74288.1 hypothetical protein [Planosporangium thailandense]
MMLSAAFKALMGVVRQRWRWILTVTVLATVTGAVVTSQQTPLYSAQMTLYMSAVSRPGDVQLYRRMLVDDRVMRAVIDKLHLDTTPAALAAEYRITVGSDRELTVAAQGSSAAKPRDLVNALTTEFIRLLRELTTGAGRPPYRTVTHTPGGARATRVSPQPARDVPASMALGLVLGLTSAAVRSHFDTTSRPTDHIDNDPATSPPSVPIPSLRPASVVKGVARVAATNERTRK